MAPSGIVLVLSPARRRALHQLACEIVACMRVQLESEQEQDVHTDLDAFPSQASGPPATAAGEVETSTKTTMVASVPGMHTTSDIELIALRRSALDHFDEWGEDVLSKLSKILYAEDGDEERIMEEDKKREEQDFQSKKETPSQIENVIDQTGDPAAKSNAAQDWAEAVKTLQAMYRPIPTTLTALPVKDRIEVFSIILLSLISTGTYSSYSHSLITYLTSALELPLFALNQEEKEIAKAMIKASIEADKSEQGESMSAGEDAPKWRQQNKAARRWKVGLASVAGAAIIGFTGSLAAPAVAGAIGGLLHVGPVGAGGFSGLASLLGMFWMNGGLAGKLFGASGAGMTGNTVEKYAREVRDFRFLPLSNERGPEFSKKALDVRRLRVTIGINGWLMSKDEICKPWCVFGDDTESFTLRYEMESLLKLGQALEDMATSDIWRNAKVEILQRTVLTTVMSTQWPIYILKSTAGIDDLFNRAKNRSEKAGRILADALIKKVQGERPVTLVGYSLGSRVIYFCLKTLAERQAFGLVDTAVFIGAPIPASSRHWQMMQSVVAGKMFNIFSEHDYVLGFLERTTSTQLGISGLQAVKGIGGLVNIDLSAEVNEHLQYPKLIASILKRCGFPDINERTHERPTPSDEEIGSESTAVADRNPTPVGPRDEAHVADNMVEPVVVKPRSKRSHREISFPSGISKIEERPVARKVQSVPASENPGPASSLVNRRSLAESSSLGLMHASGVDSSLEAVKKRSMSDAAINEVGNL